MSDSNMPDLRKIGINKSIPQLFEEQVLLTPDKTAIICQDNKTSFDELNKKSNRMAHILIQEGIKEGDVVAVLLDRSEELIISILSILKVGAVYLPLDLNYPDERLHYILKDANVTMLIQKNREKCWKNVDDNRQIFVDDIIYDKTILDSNLDIPYNPERVMYMIYTSGSTGEPKGAMVKSYSFVNLLSWYTRHFGMNNNDRILLFTSPSFDLTQKNLFAALITGGTVCIYPQRTFHPRLICELIEKEQITIINCTPSAFIPLLDYSKKSDFEELSTVRYLFLGGEPINLYPFISWMDKVETNCKIINTYGPTECTDIATFFVVDRSNILNMTSVPIGKAIDNVDVYIVDEHQNLIKDNSEGEIYIGGIGVGLGYINRNELTKEKFVIIPNISSDILYRTGDIGRKNEDGNIDYVGRVDNQVKYHGFRIELEEIEKKINQYIDVKQSLVTLLNHDDIEKEKILAAYYTSDIEVSNEKMITFLSDKIPNYMIPVKFCRVDEFPLSNNGKIDRKTFVSNLNAESLYERELLQNDIDDVQISNGQIDIIEIFKKNVADISDKYVGLDTNLSEMALDSLSFMKIIIQLEEQFSMEFDDDMLVVERFSNIESIIEYINSKVEEGC